jgi:predicted nuclease with TOPRIM domain|tara:strand:+ start:1449 stop:1700 length:252 start_codon:yes stop_codon:yes gene_type:complete
MKVQKLSKEEVAELKEIQNKGNQISYSLGQIHVAKYGLEKKTENLQNQLDDLQKKENELANKLTEKYGEGNIDLEKEEFTKTN